MVSMTPVDRTGRKTRRPQYPFYVRSRPWELVPFLLAPVLPGETFKDALLQSRVVTDPIKNRFVGWWMEYFFFYVRHRDLDIAADLEEMMLDPEKDMSMHFTAASAPWFHQGGVNYRKLCLDKVVEHYFRAPNEGAVTPFGDYPVATIDTQDVLDSAITDAEFVGAIDVDVDENADSTITTAEIDKAMRMWQFARANNLTDMDYDDYLRTFGIKVPEAQSDKPELMRFIREWQYPSNTINPANGSATTAVSWAIRDKINKDRFFREPGFIIGISCARPKVYLGNHAGSFTASMHDAMAWLPAIMRDDPYTSLRKFEQDVRSPLANQTGDYWVDIKDLFLYGEQFVNTTSAPLIAMPTAALEKRYPTLAMAQGLFVDSTPGTLQHVEQDGIINLSVLGSLTDTTPAVRGLVV